MLVAVGVFPLVGSKHISSVPEQPPPVLPQTQLPEAQRLFVVPVQAGSLPHLHVPLVATTVQVSVVPVHVAAAVAALHYEKYK